MAWESRRNGRRYFYRAERRGERVVKTYVGSGQAARDYEQQHIKSRRRLAERRAATQRLIHRVVAVESEVSTIEHRLRQLTENALIDAGFKWHRGSWRKTRRSRNNHV